MEKLSKKVNWAFNLSLLSSLAIIIVIGYWWFETKELAVVTLETFIGVTVAILAIIVTIAIGWQISSVLEIKSELNAIEKVKKEMNEIKGGVETLKQDLEKEKNETSHLAFANMGLVAMFNSRHPEGFIHFTCALKYSMSLAYPINTEPTLNNMQICIDRLEECKTVTEDLYNHFINCENTIKKSAHYELIKMRYESLATSFKLKVSKE